MNIAIVGGRDFSDYTLLKESLLAYIDTHETPENIVSGGAKGADTLAAQFATEMDIPLLVFKPDYQKYGRGATLVRNNQKVPKIALLKRKNYKKNCILYPTEKKQKRIKKSKEKMACLLFTII